MTDIINLSALDLADRMQSVKQGAPHGMKSEAHKRWLSVGWNSL